LGNINNSNTEGLLPRDLSEAGLQVEREHAHPTAVFNMLYTSVHGQVSHTRDCYIDSYSRLFTIGTKVFSDRLFCTGVFFHGQIVYKKEFFADLLLRHSSFSQIDCSPTRVTRKIFLDKHEFLVDRLFLYGTQVPMYI
jgi:hypothetical protein